MASEWERGFAAGYLHGWKEGTGGPVTAETHTHDMKVRKTTKKKRAPSAYNKKYAAAFKKVAPKFKKKNGGWVKNGFKRAGAAARKMIK